ncbi:hypothetical protein HNR40_000176 [Nonomuraea endophytica]|uniref:Uncharacterized protein n=1 Tax=Nonomuraea endophytica TaxID=714136 RepID=A0A7W7ZVV0_9ACTN|nr:hypothetical protein [Nonomuraea endophytica]
MIERIIDRGAVRDMPRGARHGQDRPHAAVAEPKEAP